MVSSTARVGASSFHDRRGSTGRAQTKPILGTEASAQLRDRLLSELTALSSGGDAAKWAHGILAEKNKLNAADAQIVEIAFARSWKPLGLTALILPKTPRSLCPDDQPRQHEAGLKNRRSSRIAIDKSALAMPEPRRVRDRAHVTFVARHPCLICGRLPADAHHLRFAQSRALSRKVSDEFTVPLCRGHHREVHHCGDEAAWWKGAGIDPSVTARSLWLETHPLQGGHDELASGPNLDPQLARRPQF